MAGRWVDVGEAARGLGISTDAVRKRISRGSLRSERQDGAVVVWLDSDGTGESDALKYSAHEEMIEELREQVRYLRSSLQEERDARRRADTIIAQLTQANATLAARIPELEAPQEAPGASESPEEGRERVESSPTSAGPQRAPERPHWREEAQDTLREIPGILRDARGAWRRFLQR
jgi:hypothetical protein